MSSLPAGSNATLQLFKGCAGFAAQPYDHFTADVAGSYTVQLVTTDNFGQSSPSVSQTLTAISCGPVFGAESDTGDATVQVTVPVSEACNASAALTYAWKPLWVSTGTFPSVAPGTADAGTEQTAVDNTTSPWGELLLQLTATDQMGRSTQDVVLLDRTPSGAP